MTHKSTSTRDRIDVGFAILVVWIGTFLGFAYHAMRNRIRQDFDAATPSWLMSYSIVVRATPILALALTVVSVILMRRDETDRNANLIRCVVNLCWLIGVVLPMVTHFILQRLNWSLFMSLN